MTVGAGVRKITKNAKVNAVVYDSLKLKSTQYNATGNGDAYFPLSARSVLNIGMMGGFLESPSIFQNELYRFGGLKTLRGFDESSLLASRYIIGKAEYRFILEQNSYLLLFFNEAYYENRGATNFLHDHPYGFGVGLTFETKAGIFSFTYALGSQQNNPILFKSGKIHFGLVNYF
jgi:hemolysin activation/secretion protein